jgi:hypothetical protein
MVAWRQLASSSAATARTLCARSRRSLRRWRTRTLSHTAKCLEPEERHSTHDLGAPRHERPPSAWILRQLRQGRLSAYYCRDPQHLIRVMGTSPAVLRTQQDGQVANFRDWHIQLGRRVRASSCGSTSSMRGSTASAPGYVAISPTRSGSRARSPRRRAGSSSRCCVARPEAVKQTARCTAVGRS